MVCNMEMRNMEMGEDDIIEMDKENRIRTGTKLINREKIIISRKRRFWR